LDAGVNLVKSTNKRPIKVGSMSVLTVSGISFFFKCYLYWILSFLNRWYIYLFYLNQYVS
jgi:hypothetical protein